MIKNKYKKSTLLNRLKLNTNKFCIALFIVFGLNNTKIVAQLITYTFTSAGSTGMNGPTQGQVNSAYLLTNLNGSVNVNNGIQSFTIPNSGPYQIKCYGAQGATFGGLQGGLGAFIQGDFIFAAGTVLNIMVGQAGITGNNGGGGGGGTGVYSGVTPSIAAGGGGGTSGSNVEAGKMGVITNTGGSSSGLGGIGGNGGGKGYSNGDCGWGSGGGGWSTSGFGGNGNWDGGSPGVTGGPGGGLSAQLFGTGGIGGSCNFDSGMGEGGFGFGGGGHGEYGGGGGGGYSGGGGGQYSDMANNRSGGGGGSYNLGINQVQTAGVNAGNGMVVITKLYGVIITQSNPIACFGQTNTALTASVGGGVAPYTYTWMPVGGNGTVATGLGAGVYTCSVTDSNGELTSTSYTITQPPLLTATITNSTNASCYGGISGSASVAVSGGVPNYIYSWVPYGGSNPTAFGLAAGSYTVFIVDVNGCQTKKQVTITQPAFPLTINATTNQVCAGQPVTILAGGASTYSFSGGITNAVAFSPSTTTAYTVTGTNTLSGCVNTVAITITVYPKPVILTGGSGTVCGGQMIALSADGAYTYTWTPGNLNGFIVNVSPTVTTTYSVVGTSTDGCVSAATATALVFITNQNCVGIEELSNSLKGLLVYPNPTNGEVTFELSNGLNKTIEINDMMGRIVLLNESNNDKVNLNISSLANGVYSAKIKSGDGIKVLKIVKQ